jgi:hypothetical protein
MYELLLRTETLLVGLATPVLAALGIGAVVVGLVLWLGGTRYSAVIIGLLGAVVGTATIFLGAPAALLAAGVPLVSDLASRQSALPVAFLVMTVVGWVWQLFYAGPKKPGTAPVKEAEPSD